LRLNGHQTQSGKDGQAYPITSIVTAGKLSNADRLLQAFKLGG
jgi:hypothetical protein